MAHGVGRPPLPPDRLRTARRPVGIVPRRAGPAGTRLHDGRHAQRRLGACGSVVGGGTRPQAGAAPAARSNRLRRAPRDLRGSRRHADDADRRAHGETRRAGTCPCRGGPSHPSVAASLSGGDHPGCRRPARRPALRARRRSSRGTAQAPRERADHHWIVQHGQRCAPRRPGAGRRFRYADHGRTRTGRRWLVQLAAPAAPRGGDHAPGGEPAPAAAETGAGCT